MHSISESGRDSVNRAYFLVEERRVAVDVAHQSSVHSTISRFGKACINRDIVGKSK